MSDAIDDLTATAAMKDSPRFPPMLSYFIDLLIVGFSIGIVYGLVAIGISLIYSGLDIVHFAHGEIYMFGAFIGLTLFHDDWSAFRAVVADRHRF